MIDMQKKIYAASVVSIKPEKVEKRDLAEYQIGIIRELDILVKSIK